MQHQMPVLSRNRSVKRVLSTGASNPPHVALSMEVKWITCSCAAELR